MHDSSVPVAFGVIGGMGPASTLRFLELVIAKYRVRDFATQNSDFPQITLYTVPNSDHMSETPDRGIIRDLETAFRIFEVANASFAVAPCNTVHQFLPIYEKKTDVQFLDIVNAVLKTERNLLRNKRVLFMSTRQTKVSYIYDPLFRGANCEPVFWSLKDQNYVDAIIMRLNSGGRSEGIVSRLSMITENYDTETVLLACTELSLLDWSELSRPTIGSLEALAEATYMVSSGKRPLSFYIPA
jgi:aspartate racemase